MFSQSLLSRFASWAFLLLIGVLFYSCGNNPLAIDVSNVQVKQVSIERFDRDFFSLNADNIVQKLPELQKKYPEFTDLFIKNVLCPAGLEDNSCIPEITKFLIDKDMRSAYDECQKKFQRLNDIAGPLREAFKHYHYYFPDKKIPSVLAMMSGFNYSIATADSVVAIGLEMYLGRKTPFYEMMQIPNYKRSTMQREYITCDFMHALFLRDFPNNIQNKTLLGEMIFQGRHLYLIDAMAPDENDTIKIGFTKKQLDWCVEHEKDMWGHLIQNKFLYSPEVEVITKFTGEGPFTTGFVKDSPARTGVWLGWKIVKQYMKENPKISLKQLMDETDPQKILALSKYKP